MKRRRTVEFVEVERPSSTNDAADAIVGAMMMATAAREASESVRKFGSSMAHVRIIDYPDRIAVGRGMGKGLVVRMADFKKEIDKIVNNRS